MKVFFNHINVQFKKENPLIYNIDVVDLFKDKLHICVNLSLSFTPYFNLVSNLSIVLIWSLTFLCYVNLVFTVIFWMEIADVANGQNKKFVYCHIDYHLV